MTTFSSSFASIILSLIVCLHCFSNHATCETDRITYIVHVHKPPPDYSGSHRDWHEAFLPQPRISSDGEMTDSRLVCSYTHALSGFAARLTEEELEGMRHMEGFLHAEPNQQLSLQTTHTPAFLGLNPGPNSFWSSVAGYGRGVIIGVVDTGVDPTHPSFNDKGMPPPPPRWKGKCEFKNASLCNNKLIGARKFRHNDASIAEPFDVNGHGTHTASTAAGRFVPDASLLGSAKGMAAGIAPDAWVAIYSYGKGSTSEVIAAIDAAVEEGVDVLSLSIGMPNGYLLPMYNSTIDIASFGAVRKGVFVSASAGNDGPVISTVLNTPPWVLTVGASTMDRRIRAIVVLGNGQELEGQSAYQPTNFTSSFLPVVRASACHDLELLQGLNVSGTLVVCTEDVTTNPENATAIIMGKVVKAAGGAGMILIRSRTRGFQTVAQPHFLPSSQVSTFDGTKISAYLIEAALAGSDPTASLIFKGTEIGAGSYLSAPAVASFSSRGPKLINQGILKPDIIGPGVDVLAAWPEPVGPYPIIPAFNLISGTSMACPHLSGVAALLKNVHPEWSPAMIKSSMMTTADLKNLKGRPITDVRENKQADYFATGAGHVNPLRAANPGLVYDTKIDDYIPYLCGLGYTDKQVSMITMERTKCSAYKPISEADLNYPSLTMQLSSPTKSSYWQTTKQVIRTVTNVGEPFSSYRVRIIPPPGVVVIVEPETLYFTEVGQKQSFRVTIQPSQTESPPTWFSEGLMTWISYDGRITVNSPISVLFGSPSA